MEAPVIKGERIIIRNWPEMETKVADVFWVPTEARWCIIVDWGEHGFSKVYDDDQDRIWSRVPMSQHQHLNLN